MRSLKLSILLIITAIICFIVGIEEVVDRKRKVRRHEDTEDTPDGTAAFIIGALVLIVGIAILTRALIGMVCTSCGAVYSARNAFGEDVCACMPT